LCFASSRTCLAVFHDGTNGGNGDLPATRRRNFGPYLGKGKQSQASIAQFPAQKVGKGAKNTQQATPQSITLKSTETVGQF
jgi:hypothetical protein